MDVEKILKMEVGSVEMLEFLAIASTTGARKAGS